jgi:hypothetical protein
LPVGESVGDVLFWDGTSWVANAEGVPDVNATLVWDGATWIPTLAGLVGAGLPPGTVIGQGLVWTGALWAPQPIGSVLSFGAGSTASGPTTLGIYPGYSTAIAAGSTVNYRVPRAGVAKNLHAQFGVAGTAAGASLITFRVLKNDLATALMCSQDVTVLTSSDVVNRVAFAQGDRICIVIDSVAFLTTPLRITASVEFE